MKISKFLATTLCLSLLPAQTLTSPPARAGNDRVAANGDLPLGATSATAPIGKVESTGRITINGRAAGGKEAIWDGELLQVPTGSNASVLLDAIGQVTLMGGSVARLATVSTKLKDQINRRALSASVVNGEMNVKLNGEAMAFVQAGRSAYLATAGANFHVSVRDDDATFRTLNGAVLEMGNWAIKLPPMPTGTTKRDSLVNSIRLLSGSVGTESSSAAKLHAKATAGMIGRAESSGEMIINGRSVQGREWLWDGEVLRSPNASAQVTLNGIGKVMLSSGSAMRLSVAVTGPGSNNQRRALVASLIQGQIIVILNSDSEAYLESNNEAFVASGGSEFRLSSRKSGATVGLMKGDVHSIGGWTIEISPQVAELLGSIPSIKSNASSHKYFILPIGSGYQTSIQAMKTRELKFRVTDQHSQPAPGLPVTFTLGTIEGKGIGALGDGRNAGNSFTAVTDVQGFATVPFKAGGKPGSVSISANLDGASESRSNVITVTKTKENPWATKNAALAIGAAIIVTGIIIVATKDDRLPIKGTGPVQIIP